MTITNKKVRHEYTFIETHTVGMVLKGSEVKTIKDGNVSLVDAFCQFIGDELYVRGMNIPGSKVAFTHEPLRVRKLLMKKRELRKLKKQLINGLTLVPYKIFTTDRGLLKMEIVLGKGKKLYDKRNDIKAKDIQRDVDRGL